MQWVPGVNLCPEATTEISRALLVSTYQALSQQKISAFILVFYLL